MTLPASSIFVSCFYLRSSSQKDVQLSQGRASKPSSIKKKTNLNVEKMPNFFPDAAGVTATSTKNRVRH
jgi:hypothetical protein